MMEKKRSVASIAFGIILVFCSIAFYQYDVLSVIFWIILLYTLPASIITLIIWFIGRKKVNWLKIEFLFVFIPLLIWPIASSFSPGSKGFGNLILEPFFCGIPAGFILLPRLLIPAPSDKTKILITFISALIVSIIVGLITFFVPFLGSAS